MDKIRITQVKSIIGRPERQKRTMLALGLKKMNQSSDILLFEEENTLEDE